MATIEETRRALLALAPAPAPAKSLYLPLVPIRKFPPDNDYRIPDFAWLSLFTGIAASTIFSFQSDGNASGIRGRQHLHEIIKSMRTDPTVVINRQLTLRVETAPPVDLGLRVEYIFCDALIDKIIEGPYGEAVDSMPLFYHYSLDLITQIYQQRNSVIITRDEVGNIWARVRNHPPYRENGFYNDVTAIGFRLDGLVRIVFAEHDRDLSRWDQYGWFASVLQDEVWSRTPSLTPIVSDKQGRVMHGILKKLSELFTKSPR